MTFARIEMIRLAVFDFDGVFTDGKCYFDGDANIRKHYNVKDGMALSVLRDRGASSLAC